MCILCLSSACIIIVLCIILSTVRVEYAEIRSYKFIESRIGVSLLMNNVIFINYYIN